MPRSSDRIGFKIDGGSGLRRVRIRLLALSNRISRPPSQARAQRRAATAFTSGSRDSGTPWGAASPRTQAASRRGYPVRQSRCGLPGHHPITAIYRSRYAAHSPRPDTEGEGPCRALLNSYQVSPAGLPAMFQLQETIGVMPMYSPGPTRSSRSTGGSAWPQTRMARAMNGLTDTRTRTGRSGPSPFIRMLHVRTDRCGPTGPAARPVERDARSNRRSALGADPRGRPCSPPGSRSGGRARSAGRRARAASPRGSRAATRPRPVRRPVVGHRLPPSRRSHHDADASLSTARPSRGVLRVTGSRDGEQR